MLLNIHIHLGYRGRLARRDAAADAGFEEGKHPRGESGKFATASSPSSTFRKNEHVASLEGGFTLRDVSHKTLGEESPEFYIHDPSGKHVGSVSLYTYPEIGKTINEINVHGARGKGLGSQAIKALAKKYGKISSDPQGNTSIDATKMWERLGAKKIVTKKNTKGFFYQLSSGT